MATLMEVERLIMRIFSFFKVFYLDIIIFVVPQNCKLEFERSIVECIVLFVIIMKKRKE